MAKLGRMGELKNEGRSFMNSYFFGSDAVLSKLLNVLEGRFGILERILQQYSREEILNLFDGKEVSDAEMVAREKAFYFLGKKGTLLMKTGEVAENDIKKFK